MTTLNPVTVFHSDPPVVAATATPLPVIGAANSGTDIGDVTINNAAGTSAVNVKSAIQYVTVDMTTPTDAQDAGDVVAATQIVAACTPGNDLLAVLHTMTLVDPDDQKAKLRVVFFDANTTLGTEDAAPDIDDTEAQTIIGMVDINAADYVDLGGVSVVNFRNLGLVVKPATGTDDIYMAVYTPDTSTPTYAGGHLYFRLGFI